MADSKTVNLDKVQRFGISLAEGWSGRRHPNGSVALYDEVRAAAALDIASAEIAARADERRRWESASSAVQFANDHKQAREELSPNAEHVYVQSCANFAESLASYFPGNPQNYIPLSHAEILTRLRVLWELGYDYGADAVRAKRDGDKAL
jgi:hypothetical protein